MTRSTSKCYVNCGAENQSKDCLVTQEIGFKDIVENI